MEAVVVNEQFWRDRRVLLTGHTGFKGAWLASLLTRLGARVQGLALAPPNSFSLYSEMAPWDEIDSHIADIRSKERVAEVVQAGSPEVVIHLASQALVRPALADPFDTFSTNVSGTVNLLQQIYAERAKPTVILVVTTDKVYGEDAAGRPFRETDHLKARDPYGASKVGQELVVEVFRTSYFDGLTTRLATARSGNVIGGGDWAPDRLVPDFFRAKMAGRDIELRKPTAVRPWQHVLDVIHGYLMYVELLWHAYEPLALNFAPSSQDERDVSVLVERLGAKPKSWSQQRAPWHETSELRLDGSLATAVLGWHSVLDFEESVQWTRAWYEQRQRGVDARQLTVGQIDDFLGRL